MREPRPCARQTQGEEQLPEQREGRHRFGVRHFNSDVSRLTCLRAILGGLHPRGSTPRQQSPALSRQPFVQCPV